MKELSLVLECMVGQVGSHIVTATWSAIAVELLHGRSKPPVHHAVSSCQGSCSRKLGGLACCDGHLPIAQRCLGASGHLSGIMPMITATGTAPAVSPS